MTTPDTSDGWTYINFDESTGSYPPRPKNADPDRTVYIGPVLPTDCMDGDLYQDTSFSPDFIKTPPKSIEEIEDNANHGCCTDDKEVLWLVGQIRELADENKRLHALKYNSDTFFESAGSAVDELIDERDRLADENRQLHAELSMWRGAAQDAYNEDSGLHCWDEADESVKDVLWPDWRES